MRIMRLTRAAYGATRGLVDVHEWPFGYDLGISADKDALAAMRARRVAEMEMDGTLVPHDSKQDEREWREHFGVLAETLGDVNTA